MPGEGQQILVLLREEVADVLSGESCGCSHAKRSPLPNPADAS